MKKLEKSMTSVLLLVAILTVGAMCEATIYFVDAGLGNTTIDGAVPVDGTNYTTTSSSGTDGLWYYRYKGAEYASNSYVWETDSASGYDTENTAALVVSMTLPTAGTYTIYGVQETSSSLRWDVSVSFDGGNNYVTVAADSEDAYYDGTYAVRDDFDWVMTDGSGATNWKYMFLATMGTVTTTADNEVIALYVQGLSGGTTRFDQRTSFDGLGYELVPEPATIALLGIGGLLLRRKRV